MKLLRDQSSTDDILQALTLASGGWVSAKELAAIRAEYKRPIWQLRHERGIEVINKTQRSAGKTHGYYRIPRYAGEPNPPLPGSSPPAPKNSQTLRQSSTPPNGSIEPQQALFTLTRCEWERGLRR